MRARDVRQNWRLAPMRPSPSADVIIVLYLHDDVVATLQSIDSIFATFEVSADVYVVDPGSSDVSSIVVRQLRDVTCIQTQPNAPVAYVVEEILCRSTAEFLIFLSDDVVFAPDCLVNMLSELRTASMTGTKVLDIESDQVVHFGGEFAAYTHGRYRINLTAIDEEVRAHGVARAQFSPGCFGVRRDFLLESGGFDATFADMEVAGCDLAARLRVTGRAVTIHPGSVVYLTNRAFSRDVREEDWLHLVARPSFRKLLNASWSKSGQKVGPPKIRPRLLYIDEETPESDRNSGSLDAFNIMSLLVDLGFEVLFVPASNFAYRLGYTERLRAAGVRVLTAPDYCDLNMVLRQFGATVEVVFLCRVGLYERAIQLVRAHAPQAKVIFNTVDLHFLRIHREAELSGDRALELCADALKSVELAAVADADATIVLSRFEKELIERELQDDAGIVRQVPLVREIRERASMPGWKDRLGVVFVGTYQHPPNVDAAVFMARSLWPKIRENLPDDARLYLVGGSVTEDVTSLQSIEGVEVLGYVADLDGLMDRCRVSVAPLRFGAGLKGKVATALLAGVPTIATSIAVEGSEFRAGMELIVADDPDDLVRETAHLYTDEQQWNSYSTAGRERARALYSMEANRVRLLELLRDIGYVPAAD